MSNFKALALPWTGPLHPASPTLSGCHLIPQAKYLQHCQPYILLICVHCAAQEHLKASGVPWTALITCCFYDNFLGMFPFQRQPDGSRSWSDNLGAKPLPVHSSADIGETAAGALCLHTPQRFQHAGRQAQPVRAVADLGGVAAGAGVLHDPVGALRSGSIIAKSVANGTPRAHGTSITADYSPWCPAVSVRCDSACWCTGRGGGCRPSCKAASKEVLVMHERVYDRVPEPA